MIKSSSPIEINCWSVQFLSHLRRNLLHIWNPEVGFGLETAIKRDKAGIAHKNCKDLNKHIINCAWNWES